MFRRPLFSVFFTINRFCHPVLPFFKQYTCSAAPFFNLFSYIQVLPSCLTIFKTVYMFRRPLFSIFFPIYMFCHPVLPFLKQYTCSAAPFFQSFFLYTGSAILFYHFLNSIHVPPPPFFNLFFRYTGSAILFYHLLNSIHVPPPPFFNLFSYIQILPSCFTIF